MGETSQTQLAGSVQHPRGQDCPQRAVRCDISQARSQQSRSRSLWMRNQQNRIPSGTAKQLRDTPPGACIPLNRLTQWTQQSPKDCRLQSLAQLPKHLSIRLSLALAALIMASKYFRVCLICACLAMLATTSKSWRAWPYVVCCGRLLTFSCSTAKSSKHVYA